MAAAPEPTFAQQLAASEGTTPKDLQKNALSKQYNLKVALVITETNNDKKYFDGGIDYTGVPYAFVVAVEAELVKLQEKLIGLGGEIATGGEPA